MNTDICKQCPRNLNVIVRLDNHKGKVAIRCDDPKSFSSVLGIIYPDAVVYKFDKKHGKFLLNHNTTKSIQSITEHQIKKILAEISCSKGCVFYTEQLVNGLKDMPSMSE